MKAVNRVGVGLLMSVVFFVSALHTAAGGLNKNWVPSSAIWAAHIDVERLMKSEIGGYLNELTSDPQVKARMEIAGKLLGIDPWKDLNGMTLYGLKPGDKDVVAIITGNINPSAIETFLKAGEGYEAISYGNRTIHKWVDKNKGNRPGYVCFAFDRVAIVAGSVEQLQLAVDILDNKGETMARTSILPSFQEPSDAIFVLYGVKVNSNNNQQSSMFQNANSITMAVWETAGSIEAIINVAVNPPEKTAQVEQIIRGMIAFAQLSKDENPAMTALAQSCSVEADESTVSVKFSHPVKSIMEIIRSARHKKTIEGGAAGASETEIDATRDKP